MAEATASDNRQAAIGSIYLVLFVLTAILFLMWIHRAHRNLPSLGSSSLKYSPGWAVGGFFGASIVLLKMGGITKWHRGIALILGLAVAGALCSLMVFTGILSYEALSSVTVIDNLEAVFHISMFTGFFTAIGMSLKFIST